MGNVSSAFICLLNVSNEIREYSKMWAFTPHRSRPSIPLVQRSGIWFAEFHKNAPSRWFVGLSVTATEHPHCPKPIFNGLRVEM